MEYAENVLNKLKNADIRAEIDDRSEKIGKKIRDAELAKIPFMLVIGEREMNEEKISVRRQGKGDLGSKNLEEFVEMVNEEVESKRAFV